MLRSRFDLFCVWPSASGFEGAGGSAYQAVSFTSQITSFLSDRAAYSIAAEIPSPEVRVCAPNVLGRGTHIWASCVRENHLSSGLLILYVLRQGALL